MNIDEVISELKILYPGKRIVVNNINNPTEVICEVESLKINPEKSVQVAVIDEIINHYHRHSQETYEVMRGHLIMVRDGNRYPLSTGDKITIYPGEKHSAEGHCTWLRITSIPGWSDEDHCIIQDEDD